MSDSDKEEEGILLAKDVNINDQIPENERYVVLMETNDDEMESWYYFIKYVGNEEMLQHLQNQLNQIKFVLLEGSSTFDMDLDHFVSERTAREMIHLDLNSASFHRKFDGKMKRIDLHLKKDDRNKIRMKRCFKKLGNGGIENYITDEDIIGLTREVEVVPD